MADEQFLYENFAASKLAASISDSDTELTVEAGDGAKYPEPGTDEIFPLVLVKTVSGEYIYEIVHATARVGDTITIRRGEEGTSPESFSTGDLVENRMTKEGIGIFRSQIADSAVNTAKIEDSAVTTEKIADSNITTAKLHSSERMTTANVRDQIAGSNAGAIGTYAMLRNNTGSAKSPGNTTSGSSLSWTNAGGSVGSGSPSGTWRSVGRAYSTASTYSERVSVWLRIS